MTFPDGTLIEGEVGEIMELLLQLKELMDVTLGKPIEKEDLDKAK